MSPLTTQHSSHIQAMCNKETDGSALIAACRQRFSLLINIGSVHGCVRLRVCMHVHEMQQCVLVCAILTVNWSFRCCHRCSSVILRFTLMWGPHQHTQTRKTRAYVASDSLSLIKSLAFVIIQNWLKNKGGIHGIKKNKCSFQSTSVQMGPDTLHACCLLLSSLVDLGLRPPQLFTGAALQCLLKSL